MRREFELPLIKIKVFDREIILDASNIANAKTELKERGVTAENTTIWKISMLGDTRSE